MSYNSTSDQTGGPLLDHDAVCVEQQESANWPATPCMAKQSKSTYFQCYMCHMKLQDHDPTLCLVLLHLEADFDDAVRLQGRQGDVEKPQEDEDRRGGVGRPFGAAQFGSPEVGEHPAHHEKCDGHECAHGVDHDAEAQGAGVDVEAGPLVCDVTKGVEEEEEEEEEGGRKKSFIHRGQLSRSLSEVDRQTHRAIGELFLSTFMCALFQPTAKSFVTWLTQFKVVVGGERKNA